MEEKDKRKHELFWLTLGSVVNFTVLFVCFSVICFTTIEIKLWHCVFIIPLMFYSLCQACFNYTNHIKEL